MQLMLMDLRKQAMMMTTGSLALTTATKTKPMAKKVGVETMRTTTIKSSKLKKINKKHENPSSQSLFSAK